ncbi:MAG: hypothetical protein R3B99_06350 [Polyangiales bacterium]
MPCRIEPDAIYPAAFLDSEENVVIGTAKGLGFREIQSLDPLVATILWAPDDEPEDGLSTEVDKCAEIALVASSGRRRARFDLLNRDGDRVGRFEVHVTAPIEAASSEERIVRFLVSRESLESRGRGVACSNDAGCSGRSSRPALAAMKARAFAPRPDGTLVDSLEDIAVAMNDVLEAAGLPTHSLDAYRGFVGWGRRISCTVRRRPATTRPCWRPSSSSAASRAWSREGLATLRRSAPGASSRLGRTTCAGRGALEQAPRGDCRGGRALLPDVPFVAVLGARDDVPHKPDPTAALRSPTRSASRLLECVFVGDTEVDMQTARREHDAGRRGLGLSRGVTEGAGVQRR